MSQTDEPTTTTAATVDPLRLDVLAIGAHPDDVEIGCGGTLARMAGAGAAVGILLLTRGEKATLGHPEQRRREAEAGARILGARSLDILDLGDGGLRTDEVAEDLVIGQLRRRRPSLVLAPPPRDRHPDHERAHRLVVAACYYAGLRRRAPDLGSPHRPQAVYSFMLHDPIEVSFVVDVTSAWATKQAALAAHGSQLHVDEGPADAERSGTTARTLVGSKRFARAVDGRARHFGMMIGVDRGEPFGACGPLRVDDPLTVVPRGLA